MSLYLYKPDENPEETSLPVQNQIEFECVNCHQKSANEPQFHCWLHNHPCCANCQKNIILCPICELPFMRNKNAEGSGQNRASSAVDGSKVGEENENSDGLKEGVGDKNSKKRKRDDSEAEDSQDDFIESDEKEMVIKVKANQSIKIINDADSRAVTLTKTPGAEFSITSTSTPENKTPSNVTPQVSQVGPGWLNNIFSSFSHLGKIQVGAPVVGNSSTATAPIQTATTTLLPMGNMGIGNGGYGGIGPGARIRINNSTFTANGSIINGYNNTIYGNGNVIHGSNNTISGDNNEVNGANNRTYGNANVSNKIGLFYYRYNAGQSGCNHQ